MIEKFGDIVVDFGNLKKEKGISGILAFCDSYLAADVGGHLSFGQVSPSSLTESFVLDGVKPF